MIEDEVPSVAPELEPNALYRFFDKDDRLLYVGVTMDLGTRWRKHNKEKSWFRDVVRATVEHYDTRGDAIAAESEAIRRERPRWNVQHNQEVLVEAVASPARASPVPDTTRWLRTAEAAEVLGLRVDRVRQYMEIGALRVWYIGGVHRRIDADSVEDLAAALDGCSPEEQGRRFAELRRVLCTSGGGHAQEHRRSPGWLDEFLRAWRTRG